MLELENDITAPHSLYRRMRYAATAIAVILTHLLMQAPAPAAHITPGPMPDLGGIVLAANSGPDSDVNPHLEDDTWYATTVQATPLTWGETLARVIISPNDLLPLDTSGAGSTAAHDSMAKAVDDAADAAVAFLGPLRTHNISFDAAMKGVGGASAGLMTALTFVNASTDADLARGRRIAGTGTITSDGTVGSISGIRYKVQAAVAKDADVFFTPTFNYPEAAAALRDTDSDMTLVAVDSLHAAATWLATH